MIDFTKIVLNSKKGNKNLVFYLNMYFFHIHYLVFMFLAVGSPIYKEDFLRLLSDRQTFKFETDD